MKVKAVLKARDYKKKVAENYTWGILFYQGEIS